VRFVGDRIEVALQTDGPTLELVSLEGQPTARLLSFCRQKYERLCEKRFAEDLPDLLEAMGLPVPRAVRLEVRDPRTGAVSEHRDVPMTAENRRRVWQARRDK
jgi:hypothetical protein